MDSVEAQTNSPLLLSLPKVRPIIIALGQNETSEFKRQSQVMTEKLRAHGFEVQYREIDDRNHFDVIVDLSKKSSWLFQQTISLMDSAEPVQPNAA